MIQGSDLTWSKSLPKAREKGKNTSVWPDLECVDFCRVSHESNLWVKYRVVRHPLVAMTWRPNHWTKLDKWGLGWKLDTWRWTWCWFQVDLCSTLSAISIWKLPFLWAEYCHFLPFDKKFACLTNYQERRSFPWPLVLYNPGAMSILFQLRT